MKKLMLSLTALFISACLFAADPVSVNFKIQNSFRSDFPIAKNVKWINLEDKELYEATFDYNGEEVNAFYNEEGELVSTARYISKDKLPMMAAKEIQCKYPGYIVRTIIECNKMDATCYYVTIVSEKKSYMLEASGAGNISVFKKIK